METNKLTRSYLDTLSSAELIDLADNYGIDIPDNLNRRFIIGELLDIADELSEENPESSLTDVSFLTDEESKKLPDSIKNTLLEPNALTLPSTFNESEIGIVFRNPVWLYVYWDIKVADLKKIESSSSFVKTVLRVSYFDSYESNAPVETFDIQLKNDDREEFIMISPNKSGSNKKFIRVDLVAVYSKNVTENLAVSKKLELPLGSELLGNARPGREIEISPIYELSGMKDVLKLHYETHRESFS